MVYWESIETVIKLAIAAIPVFVSPQPGGSVQALAAQAIMVGTAVLGLAVRPYAAPEDNWLLVGSSIGEGEWQQHRSAGERTGEAESGGRFLSPSSFSMRLSPSALHPSFFFHSQKKKFCGSSCSPAAL
jgi:hypothetical protein